MVCGSIGYGGVNEIRHLYSLLRNEGFDVLDHLAVEEMDYSHIKDFRRRKELSCRIVNHDLDFVGKADVLVVISNIPSYGTAIEMYVAKSCGKKVIILARDPLPTPWPICFTDHVVQNSKNLLELLHQMKKERVGYDTVP